ncbi:response regulator [candidate division KSB1 bacterium]
MQKKSQNTEDQPKKTILIVDDTKPIRILLLKKLERKYNCVLFSDPLKAVEYVKECYQDISLIISDYQMPKLNGFEFLKKIQDKSEKIPVILLSSHLTEFRVKELFNLGVKIFMAKPVKMNRLLQDIKRLLEDDEKKDEKPGI